VHLLVLMAMLTAGQAQRKASLDDPGSVEAGRGVRETRYWRKFGRNQAGGSMLGLGRTVKENRTVSFEFMPFKEENRSLVFLPQSEGCPRVPFPLKDSYGGKMIFENKEHDFPKSDLRAKGAAITLSGPLKGLTREKRSLKSFKCERWTATPGMNKPGIG
jgi:hypothetical protein